jgi:hypothetical protein
MGLLDRSHIGKTFAPVTRDVEAGRLRFFLDVIGDRERAFSKEGRLRVPPTYLFCLEMMDEPDPVAWLKGIGVNLMHILHGTQRFTYHGPSFAGDRLTFESRIDDIYEKKGGALQFIIRQTSVRHEGGDRVATLASTVVYRDPAMQGVA